MNDLERIAKELEGGEKGAALRRLGSSPEGKTLEGMIDGAELEKAFQRGDAAVHLAEDARGDLGVEHGCIILLRQSV